jgi:hypothetical protein
VSREARFTAPADAYPQLSRFEAELMWQDRNDGPRLLWTWWYCNQIPHAEFRRLLPDVWHQAEWPGSSLGSRTWLGMFTSAGFVTDCDASPPAEPLTLYRGADSRHMRGFSWTTDFGSAAWFARRIRLLKPDDAHMFEVTVPPDFVLADIAGRNEDEIVVNPNRLRGRFTPRALEPNWHESPPGDVWRVGPPNPDAVASLQIGATRGG